MRLHIGILTSLATSLAIALVAGEGTLTGQTAQVTRSFTFDQVLSFPFPENLVAARTGSRLAWTMNVRGVRNVYAAEGPRFDVRQLTQYGVDDGQELTSLAFSGDGEYLVYVRGGNHATGMSASVDPPNPSGSTVQPKIEVWSVAFSGGEPWSLGDGDAPVVAPHGGPVAFVKDGRIWTAPLDGSTRAALMASESVSTGLAWSPDGSKLASQSQRDGQVSIAILTPADGTVLRFAASFTSRDSSPTWSPDSRFVAFVRETVGEQAPPPGLTARPWSIWLGNVRNGSTRQVWKSGSAVTDALLTFQKHARLMWGASNHLVFLSYRDGWPHLYSVSAASGMPRVLTPGPFAVEDVALAPDRRSILYNANTGAEPDDRERRHLFRVPVDGGPPVQVTRGRGIEWSPIATGDGRTIAFLGSDAIGPPRPQILPLDGNGPHALATGLPDFPESELVKPEAVVLQTKDGLNVHAQLFRANSPDPKPAIVFLHGGPAQQMLLGWHYDDYYAHAYAMNQYLANRGFVVLAVNYRLGIGYGYQFQFPESANSGSTSEYDDVIAAGTYLRSRQDVDHERIGVWGLSYGGYLTALALGRASDLFAAGVDVHGAHTLVLSQIRATMTTDAAGAGNRFPWRSPVLLIHADDDRNVPFNETVAFERMLLSEGVPVQSRAIPDDVHDFLLFRSWKTVATEATEFFERTLVR